MTELTVSPRQGFLLVQHKLSLDGQVLWEDQLYDFAQAEGGKWYPHGSIEIRPAWAAISTPGSRTFEPDHQFGDDYFRFELPAGAGVMDYRAGYAYRNDPWWPEVKGMLRERFDWPPLGTGELYRLTSAADAKLENQVAPPLAVREWIHGEPVDLATLRGKVVLLNFSRADLVPASPGRTLALKHLYSLYHKSGLEIVEINPFGVDTSAAKQRVAELEIPWPVAIDLPAGPIEGPGHGKTFATYVRDAEIATTLIDHEGRVRVSADGNLAALCVSLLGAAGANDLPPLPTGTERAPPELSQQLRPFWISLVDNAPKEAKIVGHVTSAGAGVAGAGIDARITFELNLLSNDTGGTSRTLGGSFQAVAGDDGRFELGKLPKGTYEVTLRAGGLARVRQRVVVPNSDSTSRIDVDLSQADGLRGRVVDELNVPVAGASSNSHALSLR